LGEAHRWCNRLVAFFRACCATPDKWANEGGRFDGRNDAAVPRSATRYWYVSDIVLRPELGGTRAIRVLLGDGLSHWIYTAAITFPFQLLALASSKEGELLLARFGFYCYQKAHAMPDGVALFALDASREEFISLLKARGIHVARRLMVIPSRFRGFTRAKAPSCHRPGRPVGR
jgi:hypothetical protein